MSFNVYTNEFFYRTIYLVFSFISCIIISFSYIDLIIIFETYPFNKFCHKKFIAIYITDLFETTWNLCFSISFLFVYPFLNYQLLLFSSPSWYAYQLNFFKKLQFFVTSWFLTSWFFSYWFFLPNVLLFFSQRDCGEKKSMIQIQIESQISSYINWVLSFQYSFSSFICILLILIISLTFLSSSIYRYYFIKIYKKQLIFLILFLLFLFSSPEILFQFGFTALTFIFVEFLFLASCFKLYQKDNLVI